MNELKRYYPIKPGKPAEGGADGEDGAKRRFVKCYLDYSLGGVNCFSGAREPRGYYAHVSPVTVERHKGGVTLETYVGFTGGKWLLVACGRRSQKKEAEAARLFEEKHKEFVAQLLANSPDKDKVDFDHPEK